MIIVLLRFYNNIISCVVVLILCRSVNMLQHRQFDGSRPSGHIPCHNSESSGKVVLSPKPSRPSITSSESPHKATDSTSELTHQHDVSPSIKPDTAPVASLNLKGDINSGSDNCGGEAVASLNLKGDINSSSDNYGGDAVGDEEADTQTYSYQVWNGKNDNEKSMVLAHLLQGSSTYKANGIQMHSEPQALNNNDNNEMTSLNSNGANHCRTLQYYGVSLDQSVTPIEESR